MEQKVYMNYIHPSSLLKQLSDLWKADQLCDAVITVDKIIVAKAHKVVLFAVSPKLKSDSMCSSQSPILDVCLPSGVSHKSVHSFLKYIYEGYLILTKQLAVDLLKISKFLRIKCLTNCCSDYLDSLEEEESVIVLDEVPKQVKTEEFEHIRSSAVEATQTIVTKRQSDDSDKSSVKSKRQRIAQDGSSPVPSPSPRTFRTPHRSENSDSQHPQFVVQSADPLREESSDAQFVVHSGDSGDMDSDSREQSRTKNGKSVKVKSETSESCAGAMGASSWGARHGNELSNQSTLSPSFPTEISLTDLKEEPQDVEVESSFFQSISSASTSTPAHREQGQFEAQSMWFSDSGAVETLSQGASLDNQMGTQRGQFSLSQMRAQQSIKRSIQSSVSAARRARDIQPNESSMDMTAGQDEGALYDEGQEVGNDSQSQEVEHCGKRAVIDDVERVACSGYRTSSQDTDSQYQPKVLKNGKSNIRSRNSSDSEMIASAASIDDQPAERTRAEPAYTVVGCGNVDEADYLCSDATLWAEAIASTSSNSSHEQSVQSSPALLRMLNKINRKFQVLQRNQTALESKVGHLNSSSSQTLTSSPTESVNVTDVELNDSDIPEAYYIPPDVLQNIYDNSMGVGNFAKRLSAKLFPELFGPDNLRKYYSYNGGGFQKKKPLDAVGKDALRKYVLLFRPDYSDPIKFREVINSINEGLRRPLEKKKRLQAHEMPTTDMPTTNTPSTRMPTMDMPTTNMPSTRMPTTDMPTTNMPSTRMPSTEN